MKYVIEQEQLRPPMVEAVEEFSGQDVRSATNVESARLGVPLLRIWMCRPTR